MDSRLIDVLQVKVLPEYKLQLEFEDGKTGIFDVNPYLTRGVFEKLLDNDEFATAHVACGTVTWACGLDLAPECLYEGTK